MAFGTISPVPIQQYFDNDGVPLAGGKLFFYLAGTATPHPAYADFGVTIPLANPLTLDAAGRAPELFLDATAYKQILQDKNGVEIWSADNIVPPTALRATDAYYSLTGTQHNVQVPVGVVSFLTFSNALPLTVTGFAGGTPGQLLVVRASLGTGNVSFLHADPGSASGNQLYNMVYSGPTTLVGNRGTAMYIYQYPFWILVAHEQGSWIRMPYNGADFRISGGTGSWIVEANDVKQLDYRLSGTSVLVSVNIAGSEITGAPQLLQIHGLPYQVRTDLFATPALNLTGSNYVPSAIGASATARFLNIASASGTFGAQNGFGVFGQVQLDVQ